MNVNKLKIFLFLVFVLTGTLLFFSMTTDTYAKTIRGSWSGYFRDNKNGCGAAQSKCKRYTAYIDYSINNSSPTSYKVELTWGLQLQNLKNSDGKNLGKSCATLEKKNEWHNGEGTWYPTNGNNQGELWESASAFAKKTYKKKKTLNGGYNKFGSKTVTYTKNHSSYNRTISAKVSTWRGKKDGSKCKDNNETETVKLSITVPAKTHYTVTYNSNGGSSTPSAQTKWHGENLKVAGAISRAGYTFAGWKNTARNVTYQAGSNNGYEGNQTLVAQWTKNSYRLTANANGGSIGSTSGWTGTGTSSYKNVPYNDAYGTLPVSTRTGYTLVGWYNTSAASGGTNITSNTKMGASATNIYARWKIRAYTIKYDANSGTGAPEASTKEHDKTLTIPATIPKKKGYVFKSWNTAKDGSGTDYRTGPDHSGNIYYTVNSSATLYAQWVPKQVTITYDKNNIKARECSSMSPHTLTYGSSQTNLKTNCYTLKNHTFVGWKDQNGNSYEDAQSMIGELENQSGQSRELTLYAQWEKSVNITIYKTFRSEELEKDENNNYVIKNYKQDLKIKYYSDVNGNISNEDDDEIQMGDTPVGRDSIPNYGYEFAGWVCITSDIPDPDSPGEIIKKNETLISLEKLKRINVTEDIVVSLDHFSKGVAFKAVHKKVKDKEKHTVSYLSDSNGGILGSDSDLVEYGSNPIGRIIYSITKDYKFKGWQCDKDVKVDDGETIVIPAGTYMTSNQVKHIIVENNIQLIARFFYSKD